MNTKARLFSQKNKSNRLWLVFFIMLVLLLIGWYLSLRLGAVNYSHDQLLATLKHPFQDSNTQDVIIDLRLPRILAASLVGAAMAQAGAIMQGVTRNPIADPGLLGINAGAGLALILAYAFFWQSALQSHFARLFNWLNPGRRIDFWTLLSAA